jgi:4-hydroxy-3-methylbut-2-enyl diphosphate reductase
VVVDMTEARAVCDFIERGGETSELTRRFSHAMSPGFDFGRDLIRVGIANQTTMLSGESLAIANEVRQSMLRRYGEADLAGHFRTFDTICSATQERQDAVIKLLAEPLDLMVVVGGYNSSNTTHLAALCRAQGVRTYHIEDASAIDVGTGRIRFQPGPKQPEAAAIDWLGEARVVGLTAGASTPNNKIGETVLRICAVAGVEPELP